VVPAALTLRTVWLVRDLYVAPEARRHGVARALLAHVAEDARSAGAHRLSLQTETANTHAIELYARNGFDVLTDVAVMDRLL
jgi:ribosomal protein S18 acetylase RimI-like enzyme